jgi:uncharacterized protein (TIGR00730 family)
VADQPQEKTRGSHAVPTPPHPTKRQRPLPEQQPSHAAVHEIPAEVQRIIASPSYREADHDLDFLQQPQTRGIRLQLEYWKAETLLREHRIAHTIVVFGGTRIPERAAAERAVAESERALAKNPANAGLQRDVAVNRNRLANSVYYEVAREFGKLVGCHGDRARDGRLIIVTGGGPGVMEAANRGAFECGARSAGFNISLPHEQYPNPYITPELCFQFHYFALRKLHFALRGRALVVFPGGYGTMDEMFEVLCLSQTRKLPPVPIVLVGEKYWRRAFNPDFLMEQGTIDPEDRDLFWFAETAQDIWNGILHWYEKKGEPLLASQENRA